MPTNTPKKRNPQDATTRNVRAASKRIEDLERRVTALERMARLLDARTMSDEQLERKRTSTVSGAILSKNGRTVVDDL